MIFWTIYVIKYFKEKLKDTFYYNYLLREVILRIESFAFGCNIFSHNFATLEDKSCNRNIHVPKCYSRECAKDKIILHVKNFKGIYLSERDFNNFLNVLRK